MARRKTTRRKTTTRTRRSAPARAKNAPRRRRTSRKASPRRRVRRRRNPKFNVMAVLLAAAGGAVIGGGAYALDGQDLTPDIKTAIVGIGALALGMAVTGFNDKIGAGIAGAGAGIAVKSIIEQMVAAKATTTEGMGRIPAYAYAKFGHTPVHPNYRHLPQGMSAVQAELAGMGAIVADLDAVEADLIGLG